MEHCWRSDENPIGDIDGGLFCERMPGSSQNKKNKNIGDIDGCIHKKFLCDNKKPF